MPRYFGKPRWRYLLMPLILPAFFVAVPVTLLSIGSIRGMRLWEAAMDWATYGE